MAAAIVPFLQLVPAAIGWKVAAIPPAAQTANCVPSGEQTSSPGEEHALPEEPDDEEEASAGTAAGEAGAGGGEGAAAAGGGRAAPAGGATEGVAGALDEPLEESLDDDDDPPDAPHFGPVGGAKSEATPSLLTDAPASGNWTSLASVVVQSVAGMFAMNMFGKEGVSRPERSGMAWSVSFR